MPTRCWLDRNAPPPCRCTSRTTRARLRRSTVTISCCSRRTTSIPEPARLSVVQSGARRRMPMIAEQADEGQEKKAMGRFYVEFEVANNDDMALVRRGLLAADEV